MRIFLGLVTVLLAVGLAYWRFKPPQSDRQPISQEALNRILRLEAQSGDHP